MEESIKEQKHKSADYIRNIIIENKDNMAFIIGNGIHRYIETKEDIKRYSWETLLLELWNRNSNVKLESIDKGISYTEFYDLLELNNWNYRKIKRQEELKESLDKISKVVSLRSIDTLHLNLNRISSRPLTKQQSLTELLSFSREFSTSSISDSEERLAKSSRKYLTKIGVDNVSELSDTQAISNMVNLLSDDYTKESLFGRTKNSIANLMKTWEGNNVTSTLVEAIRNLNVPLLTTNFDDVLSKSINVDFNVMQDSNGNTKRTDWYPWNCYYGDKQTTPESGFGIWHINGMIKYHRSIMLGLCDYTRSLARARGIIQGKSIFECENFNGKNQNYWAGYNTWLHYIFNRSLFIFGLCLEENEVFLRWLLIQRAKYFSAYGKPYKGWYVIGPCENISNGKKLFLESVGFAIIRIDNYKTIYEDVWHSAMY